MPIAPGHLTPLYRLKLELVMARVQGKHVAVIARTLSSRRRPLS
jgi:hypothetical protein